MPNPLRAIFRAHREHRQAVSMTLCPECASSDVDRESEHRRMCRCRSCGHRWRDARNSWSLDDMIHEWWGW